MAEAPTDDAGGRRPPEARPRLLLVSMYPLDRGLWGPTVRISHLRDELARLASLDVVEGYRPRRRLRLWRYAISGRLRGLDGIYVEASSFLPSESDVAFLALARSLGIRVLTYFRDAYQLFPEYYATNTLARHVSARAFLPAMRALARVSSVIAVPTTGLGRALFGADASPVLLPPGAPEPVDVPYQPEATHLLYVGDARLSAQGAPTLIEAVRLVRERGRAVELTLVTREGQEPPGDAEEWVHIERASGDEVHALLHRVVASVIPRPRGPYNDLALPIKLFDYLSYARPLLVTPCEEQALLVTDSGAGLVIPDRADAMAAAIEGFLDLPADERRRMGRAAADAARAASWRVRAQAIVHELTG